MPVIKPLAPTPLKLVRTLKGDPPNAALLAILTVVAAAIVLDAPFVTVNVNGTVTVASPASAFGNIALALTVTPSN